MPAGKKSVSGKFAASREKHKKRRITRQHARKAVGKKEMVEALEIAPKEEREAALKQGRMVFRSGEERIALPLVSENGPLQGIFHESNGRFWVLRVGRRGTWDGLSVLRLERTASGIKEILSKDPVGNRPHFFSFEEDLGHMRIPLDIRKKAFGVKGASKAERHARAQRQGSHLFEMPNLAAPPFSVFLSIFKKIGFK